jgi:hypothetical protein
MANPIVTVQVTQTVAPTPSELQKTGAILCTGETNLTPGTTALLTSPADLAPYLKQQVGLALTTVAWTSAYGGQVTASTAAPHNIPVDARFPVEIDGVSPSGYNGTFWATATAASAFTYYLSPNPGVETVPGTYVTNGSLQAKVGTFFAQGFQQSVYLLELGGGGVAAEVAVLETFINDSAQMFYSYLVPRTWDADPAFLSLVAQYENTTGKTYFFVTTTLANYTAYTPVMKDVIALIEAPQYGSWVADALTSATYLAGTVTAATAANHTVKPGDWFTIVGATPAAYNGVHQALPGTTGTALIWQQTTDPGGPATVMGSLKASVYGSAGIPPTEFTAAAAWWVTLNYSPSETSRVPPYSYSFLFGVTRFPQPGNGPLMTTLKSANINIVGYGAEGGISDNILLYGRTMDGKPFNYWYSVDWMQINIDLDLANAIINGSNNQINPLYYNQDGINRLEAVAANTGGSAIAFGLAIGSVKQVSLDPTIFLGNINAGYYAGQLVVNAVPFPMYSQAHPGDYAIGEYDGLSMVYTPMRGFEHLIFNINVTDFVATAV